MQTLKKIYYCILIYLFCQVINLSRNSIRSMKGLQNHKLLQEIDLEENQVCELKHHTDMNYSVNAVRSKNWNVHDLLQIKFIGIF